MQRFAQSNMKGGCFLGDFEPAAIRSTAAEVGCKHYDTGATEPRHVHRVATEVTLIVSGRVRMNGTELDAGEIVLLKPGEATDFLRWKKPSRWSSNCRVCSATSTPLETINPNLP
jgi:hypothetical protein